MKELKRVTIHVEGNEKIWDLPMYAPQEHINDWIADGLDVAVSDISIPVHDDVLEKNKKNSHDQELKFIKLGDADVKNEH